MSGAATPTLVPLPGPLAALLGTFEATHAGVELRLWTRENGAWTQLYPGGGGGEGGEGEGEGEGQGQGPGPRAIAIGEQDAVRLEVEGRQPAESELEFLRAALARLLSYEREARLAARELTERYEEINVLYSISEILGSVLTLDVAASRILGEVADLLAARRASLWVYDRDDGRLHLAAAVGEEGLRGPISVEDPNSVTAKVFRDRQSVNLERGTELPRGTRLDTKASGREAFLSVPIQYSPPEGGARTVGVITLVGGSSSERFSAGDTRLLTAIASQVGAALETNRLVQESLRQERVVRELELAHDLQLKLLPDAAEFQGPAHVAARCAPADSVGGDFYHLFRLSDERLGVMIGDVSGHGFSAALIMAMTMSAVAIYAQDSGPPAGVLRRVHEALADELETTEMYLTLFYGVLEPAAGRLVYVSAGHPHAFRVSETGEIARLAVTEPPLGMLSPGEHTEAVVPWQPGSDLLCLFTDGLSDAFAPRPGHPVQRKLGDASAGEAELMTEVGRMADRAPAEILRRLFERAAEADLSVPPDDRTAVLVRA